MFTCLLKAGYQNFIMLKEQFRMHYCLLKVPNNLFYENKIVTGKRIIDPSNFFLCKDKPLLFINHSFEESRFGSSFVNIKESEMIVDMMKLLKNYNYLPSKFGFVSPYLGQIQRLKQDLSEIEGVGENIRSIDSW